MDKIARRWLDLAEQRLAHFTELYRSGRWQHYYTREAFAAQMLAVIEDARKWRQLAGLPQTLDETPGRDAAMRPAA